MFRKMAPSKLIFSILCCQCMTNLWSAHGFTTINGTNHSDLNLALQFVIGQMIHSNFFSDTWTKYFPKVLPIQIPNNCQDGKIAPKGSADATMQTILNTGKIRVAISMGSTASNYLILTNTSDASTTKSGNGNITTSGDYTIQQYENVTLDGYEPACIREAVKLLGQQYQMDIETEWYIVSGENFFGDLQSTVNQNQVDFVWSVVTVTAARAQLVDYACYTHMGEYVIASSPSFGSSMPDPSGPPVPLGCYAVSCTFTNIPKPFYLSPYNSTNGLSPANLITNVSSEHYDYILETYENLYNFIRSENPNVSQVNTPQPIAYDYRAPFTKLYNVTSNVNQGSTSSSNSLHMTTAAAATTILATLVASNFWMILTLL